MPSPTTTVVVVGGFLSTTTHFLSGFLTIKNSSAANAGTATASTRLPASRYLSMTSFLHCGQANVGPAALFRAAEVIRSREMRFARRIFPSDLALPAPSLDARAPAPFGSLGPAG